MVGRKKTRPPRPISRLLHLCSLVGGGGDEGGRPQQPALLLNLKFSAGPSAGYGLLPEQAPCRTQMGVTDVWRQTIRPKSATRLATHRYVRMAVRQLELPARPGELSSMRSRGESSSQFQCQPTTAATL